MPRAIINIVFYIPEISSSPLKKASNAVFIDILIEKFTQKIGYEATLADMAYQCKVFECVGLKFKFKGYNDKLANFITLFYETLQEIRTSGFEEYLIDNAIEKKLKMYTNLNVEIDQRTTNNRFLLLL